MQNILTQLTKQFLPQMSVSERLEALRSLRAIIESEMYELSQSEEDEGDPDRRCPRCGCDVFTKRGKDDAGRQRYLCKGCSRSFTDATMKVFSTTKLDKSVWMRFVECHVDMVPLRDSARRCGVSLKTAFFMRHRLLEALYKRLPSFQVESGCGAELDECFFRESFKGNHGRSSTGIPRKARKRPQSSDNNEKICVLTGINDAGDIFYEVAGRGGLSEDAARIILSDKLAKGAIISTDGAHVYKKVLASLSVARHNATKRADHAINRVNGLHSHLKAFIDHFKGVSTRRLSNYLAWFKWMWTFKVHRAADELAGLIVRQASKATYETSWRSYKVTPYPFFDYWVKQARWDSYAYAALYGS